MSTPMSPWITPRCPPSPDTISAYTPMDPAHVIEGVHYPYGDGFYEFDHFINARVLDARLRLRVVWRDGTNTWTSAKNFEDKIQDVMEFIEWKFEDPISRLPGICERYFWQKDMGINIVNCIPFEKEKEDSMDIIPIYVINNKDYVKTPADTSVKLRAGKICWKNRLVVPEQFRKFYITPRVLCSHVPNRDISTTPKVATSKIERVHLEKRMKKLRIK